jgi:hypothetical protein
MIRAGSRHEKIQGAFSESREEPTPSVMRTINKKPTQKFVQPRHLLKGVPYLAN